MFDVMTLRREFPALENVAGTEQPIFLDGPGGTQVPKRVIEAMVRYLTHSNANHGGTFQTSRESDRIIEDARESIADLINAPSADEIVFGANMTTLTFHLSRAIGENFATGGRGRRDQARSRRQRDPLGPGSARRGRHRAVRGRLAPRLHAGPRGLSAPPGAADPARCPGLCLERGRHDQ